MAWVMWVGGREPRGKATTGGTSLSFSHESHSCLLWTVTLGIGMGSPLPIVMTSTGATATLQISI